MRFDSEHIPCFLNILVLVPICSVGIRLKTENVKTSPDSGVITWCMIRALSLLDYSFSRTRSDLIFFFYSLHRTRPERRPEALADANIQYLH